ATTALPESVCADLYRTNPAALELREFVVSHALEAPSSSTDRALPVASLRDVVVSLLDENRHEEGVRFLVTTGQPALLHDSRVVGGLLGIFRTTAQVEEDLKQRGAFLLKKYDKQQADDFSSVWVVDNERRRKIIQSQGRVLEYLESAGTQFLRPWFDDRFRSNDSAFWDYIDELVAPPPPPPQDANERDCTLEGEMRSNRTSLALLLMKQVCADLAANLCTIQQSLFVRASSEGLSTAGQSLYPAAFMDKVGGYFDRAVRDRGANDVLARLALDMLAAATACGALSRSECVQAVARILFNQPQQSRAKSLARLFASGTFALEVIDYMLSAWFNVDRKCVAATPPAIAQAMHRPPCVEKTALRLYTARPPSKDDSPDGWCDLVGILGVLAELTMCTFCTRLWHVNPAPRPGSTADAACPAHVLLTNSAQATAPLEAALESLRERVAAVKLRPATGVDAGVDLIRLLDLHADACVH
ncbi:hypothetical protein IWQ57_000857, partial [Coemansia nantahalensis]